MEGKVSLARSIAGFWKTTIKLCNPNRKQRIYFYTRTENAVSFDVSFELSVQENVIGENAPNESFRVTGNLNI